MAVATAMAAAIPLIGLPTHAFADVTTGFELDGNVLDNSATTPPDWGATAGTNSIFTLDASNQTGVPRSPLPPTERRLLEGLHPELFVRRLDLHER